ncbi:cysteine dioxygenase type 1 [Copidosoma floridanum]|uniref:cysteine dioxygenase type 1 n=1 Tax=Copidosoma floridanum TaxID=29053 RepID=UPI0006C95F03|nr:cysteine dioxygenase type 1 [Copidosoma floridanum]
MSIVKMDECGRKQQQQVAEKNRQMFMSRGMPIFSHQVPNKSIDLTDLIEKLHEAFDTDDVDIDYVQELMSAYRSNPQDWKKYAKFDRYRYTRNLVDEGNGRFNLIVLCWGEGHGSAIHDHADAHCVMKILQGELCETKYQWPKKYVDDQGNECTEELKEIDRRIYSLNEVTYINDSIGLHRVENLSTVNTAVSLHLYSPPFSMCSVFNKQTGQRSKSQVTFWSKYGERRNREIQDARDPEDN